MELLHQHCGGGGGNNLLASSPDPLHQVENNYVKRASVYSKMELLIKEMQDEETGVPVRSQKIFLSSIPAAFAGYDVIEWLMERLAIEDSNEAIHLANLLCTFGYFFPVSNNNSSLYHNHHHSGSGSNYHSIFSVKDDSSLYRFQTPYFWPAHQQQQQKSYSSSSISTNEETAIDYAIYLSKRTLRSKQRHALHDYEVEALTNLKRSLGQKWDFVVMQADEQVRLAKDRKKQEKLVLDSQERAYWRVIKPPPPHPAPVEIPPTKSNYNNYNKNSSNKQITPRKTNQERLRIEVELLRNSCIRTRIKASCALESLASYSESYQPHDMFLSQKLNNPWICDDAAFWVVNSDFVEIPTERRLRKWAISMEDLVYDQSGLREFTHYLKKEYCHENIRFWLAVKEMKFGPCSSLRNKAHAIYSEFLSAGSPCEINIDMRTQELVHKEVNSFAPSRFMFDPAVGHVYEMLLKKDCYPRFIRSEHYKNLLASAEKMGGGGGFGSGYGGGGYGMGGGGGGSRNVDKIVKEGKIQLDKFINFVAPKKKLSTIIAPLQRLPSNDQNQDDEQQQQSLRVVDFDNEPYRGDFERIGSPQNSLQDGGDNHVCPWESAPTSSSERSSTIVNSGSGGGGGGKGVNKNKKIVPKSEEVIIKNDEIVATPEEVNKISSGNSRKQSIIIPPPPVETVIVKEDKDKDKEPHPLLLENDEAHPPQEEKEEVEPHPLFIDEDCDDDDEEEKEDNQSSPPPHPQSKEIEEPLPSELEVKPPQLPQPPPPHPLHQADDDDDQPPPPPLPQPPPQEEEPPPHPHNKEKQQEEKEKEQEKKQSSSSSIIKRKKSVQEEAEEICPWDGSTPSTTTESETFKKTYATLGYL